MGSMKLSRQQVELPREHTGCVLQWACALLDDLNRDSL